MIDIIGAGLSFGCLMVSLFELRLREDYAGRRMGAFCAAIAWTTMALIAWSQHARLTRNEMHQQTANAKPAAMRTERVAWKHTTPDGGTLEVYSNDDIRTIFTGTRTWHASSKSRL